MTDFAVDDLPEGGLKTRFAHRVSGFRGDRSKRAPWQDDLNRAVLAFRSRQTIVFDGIQLPHELPISGHADAIQRLLRKHQVIVVAGDTGSGKSTQLPKIAVLSGRGMNAMIGVTQPRRIAARAIASRVAEELSTELGTGVGFQVRFDEQTAANTRIKVMTDGVLLNEIQRDRYLNAYDTLIIDEAHERSLNIDFLLGHLRWLLPRRPDLKVIVTSATIDTQRFAEYFRQAPVVEVSGRSYPIEIRYRDDTDDALGDNELPQAIAGAVRELKDEGEGDMLVFLASEQQIRQVSDHLGKAKLGALEVLPLYARLSRAQQQRVFNPGRARRVVLATNVAETSLTVPRIAFVIDSGLARISRYSLRQKVQQLPIEPISQASANQRAGRCGRLGPGICVRLYSRQDFASREAFTPPEILRTSLATLILTMQHFGLGDPSTFKFIDPPDARRLNDGYQLLTELQAIDRRKRITPIGRAMAGLPLDVRLARILIEGQRLGLDKQAITLVAGLAAGDPRERPAEARKAADKAHAELVDERSDFLSLLSIKAAADEQRAALSNRRYREWCQQHFLSYLRLREWGSLMGQLRHLNKRSRLPVLKFKGDEAQRIHRMVLAGLVSQIAMKDPEKPGYIGTRSREIYLFPGSVRADSLPNWIVAAELAETSRLFARMVAPIDPRWVESVAKDLLSYSHYDPHWSKSRGHAQAFEQVTLYGLKIIAKRPVNLARYDDNEARRLFIVHALVRGEMLRPPAFLKKNQALVDALHELETRQRRRDIAAEEMELARLYDERLPEDIRDVPGLRRWLKEANKKSLQALEFRKDEIAAEFDDDFKTFYPDTWRAGDIELPLNYRFKPGDKRDGVVATVAIEQLPGLDAQDFLALVPGMRSELIYELLRKLPKPIRRSLPPMQALADRIQRLMDVNKPASSLSEAIKAETDLDVPIDDWLFAALADHLRFGFDVVDYEGERIGFGRDLAALQQRYAAQAAGAFRLRADRLYRRDHLQSFPDVALPEQVMMGQRALAFPAVVDQGDAVGVRLYPTIAEAQAFHRQGLIRLLLRFCSSKVNEMARRGYLDARSGLIYQRVGGNDLIADMAEAVARRLLEGKTWGLRDRAAFDFAAQSLQRKFLSTAATLADQVNDILLRWRDVFDDVENTLSPAAADIGEQLAYLVYPGFVREVPADVLIHYPRWLAGAEHRWEKAQEDPRRDLLRANEVAPFWDRYKQLADDEWTVPAVASFHTLIEEYRVQRFAQHLGTAQKVSEKVLRLAADELPS